MESPRTPSSPRKTSSFDVKFKSVGPDQGAGAGQLKAFVSVFGNVDSVGDVVMPGAFTKSLAGWGERGDALPLVWSHDWADPCRHIGVVKSARETDTGLEIEAQLDLDNPKAVKIHRLMRGRRVKAWSFAYDIVGAIPGERDGDAIQEIRELDILETMPTLLGVNRQAVIEPVRTRAESPASVSRVDAALAAVEGEGTHLVYKLFDRSGVLLYVGITSRGPTRLAEHYRSKPWFNEVVRVEFERFKAREICAARETFLIKALHPRHNIIHNAAVYSAA